ncbi:MAG: hypothetical protein CFE44_21885 [Burkholderiales bacterium PBB4]|nr:MAG: hypothetical protein CFE44_21885 [Burkholderiales bacterium PBB4]
MMKLARLALLSAAVLSQSAWADNGPYYVSYPGFCNVKKVYMNAYGDIYGSEVGCTASLGRPLIGVIDTRGNVVVTSPNSTGGACFDSYGALGVLEGGCSYGGSIVYDQQSRYSVRSADKATKARYVFSTDPPNLELTRHLPERP